MLNRRLIRIKAFKELFSRVSTNNFDVQSAKNELEQSFQKTKELYCMVQTLPLALEKLALNKIDLLNQMFNPSIKEINKHNCYISSPYIKSLSTNREFLSKSVDQGFIWDNFYESALKQLYTTLLDSDIFADYTKISQPSLNDSIALFDKFYRDIIIDYEPLIELLEERSIWWREDFEYCVEYFLNDNTKFSEEGRIILKMANGNEKNEIFGVSLLSAVLQDYDDFTEIINSYLNNWELERLVMSDIIIISMGLAEVLRFEDIPPKSTINEYVEITKYYSTTTSHTFVNGVLNKIFRALEQDNKIKKSPKGLTGMLTDSKY